MMRPNNARRVLAWLPAAVFGVVVAWIRFGAVVAILAVAGGLGMAFYAERKDRRRRERGDGGTDPRSVPNDEEAPR